MALCRPLMAARLAPNRASSSRSSTAISARAAAAAPARRRRLAERSVLEPSWIIFVRRPIVGDSEAEFPKFGDELAETAVVLELGPHSEPKWSSAKDLRRPCQADCARRIDRRRSFRGARAFAGAGPPGSWSLCRSRGWRRLRRFGPVPKPPQEAKRALAQDLAPEQGRANDCEEHQQFGPSEGLAGYGVKRPEDNGRRQRTGADRQQVPATFTSGQRSAR